MIKKQFNMLQGKKNEEVHKIAFLRFKKSNMKENFSNLKHTARQLVQFE